MTLQPYQPPATQDEHDEEHDAPWWTRAGWAFSDWCADRADDARGWWSDRADEAREWRESSDDPGGAAAQERVPARPIGAQLARLGDGAMNLPVDLLVALGRELGASILGALILVDRWRAWQQCVDDQRRLADGKEVAAAQGLGQKETPYERLYARQGQRARLTGTLVGAAVLVTVCCCVADYTWGWAQWLGAGVTVALAWYAWDTKTRWLIALAPAPVLLAIPFGVSSWRWWPALIPAVLLLVVCELVGKKLGPDGSAKPTVERGKPGVSLPRTWETIRLELLAEGITATSPGGRPTVAEGDEVWAAFPYEADAPITPKALARIERRLYLPVGGARDFPERRRNGSGVLHVRWADVLDQPGRPPRPQATGDGTVHERQRLARGQLGRSLQVSLLRVSLIVLGGTGSGKTSLGWVLLDGLAECRDRKAWGIDLRRKNLIAPYVRLFEGRVAYTAADAEKLLDAFQAEIDRRVERIALKLEDADEDDVPDENWIPTEEPGHEQLELFVDELTSLTPHKPLREKLALIEETGRQAACVVRLFTPDLDSKKIGDSSIFDQPHVKIVMATSQYDIKEMFGPGASAAGWGLPATWERPADAGKLLISSDEHLQPEVYRADRFEVEDIVARRKARRAMPGSSPPPRPETTVDPDEPVDAVVIPEPLATLARLVEESGGAVHTATLLAELNRGVADPGTGWTDISVAKALRGHGLRSSNRVVGDVRAKGYAAQDVIQAVLNLENES